MIQNKKSITKYSNITNASEIANHFNMYFADTGPNLAKNILNIQFIYISEICKSLLW